MKRFMEPFLDPQHYHLHKENLWIWESGFFFLAGVLLAVSRRYTRFIQKHPGLMLAESILWGLDSAIIILGVMMWRHLNGHRLHWSSSLRLAMIVCTAVMMFSIILEIGGVNTVILGEKYRIHECTLGETYCDAEASKNLLFEIASIWMVIFIYVITAYFVFNRKGIFKEFTRYYYPRPFGQGTGLDRFVGTIMSCASSVIVSLLSWVLLLLLTPLYCLFFLFVPNKTWDTFQNLWHCMKEMLFRKIPEWNDWRTGYILFLWGVELIVCGLIFATPVFFVIWNRLRTSQIPVAATTPIRPDRVLYLSEFVLLFCKYFLIIGLKMMIEIVLSP